MNFNQKDLDAAWEKGRQQAAPHAAAAVAQARTEGYQLGLAAASNAAPAPTPAPPPELTPTQQARNALASWKAEIQALPEAACRPQTVETIFSAHGPKSLTVEKARRLLAGLPSEQARFTAPAAAPQNMGGKVDPEARLRRSVELRLVGLNCRKDAGAHRLAQTLTYALAHAENTRQPLAKVLGQYSIDPSDFER